MSQVEDLGSEQRTAIQELDADCPVIAVSIPRAAEITDLSTSELYNEMKSGRLPFVKHGRRRLIMVDDLKTLLLSGRVAA
jgi:excisionase family DNA binding protein